MKKFLIIGGIVVVLGILIAVNLMKEDKGESVETAKVEKGRVVQKVTGSGQIRPEVQVKVSANVPGKIIKLMAEEGDQVKKGQLLVELEQEQYIAAVDRAESNLLSMLANEKKLKSELNRSRNLFEQNLISKADIEATEAAYESAESNTRQARAQLKEAKDQLAKTSLRADMDGIVTKLNKEVGEIALGAQFQEDVIMVISDLSKMEAAIEVDENDVVNTSIGDTADIEIDAFSDTTFKGVVTQIANSATIKGLGTQEQVTNFEVTVALLDYNGRFRPGMSTTVDIFTETRNNVLKVPIQAVTVREPEKLERKVGVEEHADETEAAGTNNEMKKTEEKDKELVEVVFCVEEGKAVAKKVKLGISDDSHYEVLAGLSEGEEVITGPFRLLSRTLENGAKVEVSNKNKGDKNAD